MSTDDIARHRNYGKIMRRHSRYLKMKRSVLALVYFLILVLMILFYMLVKRMETEKKLAPKGTPHQAVIVKQAPPAGQAALRSSELSELEGGVVR